MDDRVPGHRDSHASSSHGLSLEPTRSADLGRSARGPKLQGPPCRTRIGGAVPRAEMLVI